MSKVFAIPRSFIRITLFGAFGSPTSYGVPSPSRNPSTSHRLAIELPVGIMDVELLRPHLKSEEMAVV